MIPAPPTRPLERVGDVLEGQLLAAQEVQSLYGLRLQIKMQTAAGPIEYRANPQLWRALYAAAAGEDRPWVRITRLDDSPAVGNNNPGKNFQVDRIAAPAPAAPAYPVRQYGNPPAAHPAPAPAQPLIGPQW